METVYMSTGDKFNNVDVVIIKYVGFNAFTI